MKIIKDVCLCDYTTFKIGGLCRKLWFPENDDDVMLIWENAPDAFAYCIGNGSNLLINQKIKIENAICTRELNKKIQNKNNGKYSIGAGVTLQSLIERLYEDEKGGIEYLYSVPGTVGGATVMNAGRGREYGLSISDHIGRVKIFQEGRYRFLSKTECDFSYRHSLFQEMKNVLVLSIEAHFDNMPREEIESKIEERKEIAKKQDTKFPNAGSIFKTCDYEIMTAIRERQEESGPVVYSRKTANWLLNLGGGTYEDVRKRIDEAIEYHRIKKVPIELEIIEWTGEEHV